jgi:hypothetical protein
MGELKIPPTRAIASTFGAIAGLSNMAYAVAEALEGHARPAAGFFTLNGQPAITVLPDMLVTGVIGFCLGLAFAICAIFYSKRWRGGLMMLLIACLQIPFGAGLVRLFQAMIYGLVGTRIGRPLLFWNAILPRSMRPKLSRLWPASFAVCAILYVIHALTGAVPSLTASEPRRSILLALGGYGNLVCFLLMLVCGFARELEMRAGMASSFATIP